MGRHMLEQWDDALVIPTAYHDLFHEPAMAGGHRREHRVAHGPPRLFRHP